MRLQPGQEERRKDPVLSSRWGLQRTLVIPLVAHLEVQVQVPVGLAELAVAWKGRG